MVDGFGPASNADCRLPAAARQSTVRTACSDLAADSHVNSLLLFVFDPVTGVTRVIVVLIRVSNMSPV